ncbi:MAG TPA: hypothetical protein VGD87_12800, partial [Archangium sp.]
SPSTAATSQPRAAPPPKTLAPEQATVASGWKAGKTTVDQRRMLDRTLVDAITLPAGPRFLARLGHVRAALGAVGSDGKRVVAEQLLAKLPARSPEERGRMLAIATAVGAKTPALTDALLKDAITSGDARLALELVHDGASLSKSQKLELAPHLLSDEVLLSADSTKSLARAAISVLADQPNALERFARSLTSPAVLFSEALANRDQANARALAPLVGLLSPKEAKGLARLHPRSAIAAELRARAGA